MSPDLVGLGRVRHRRGQPSGTVPTVHDEQEVAGLSGPLGGGCDQLLEHLPWTTHCSNSTRPAGRHLTTTPRSTSGSPAAQHREAQEGARSHSLERCCRLGRLESGAKPPLRPPSQGRSPRVRGGGRGQLQAKTPSGRESSELCEEARQLI